MSSRAIDILDRSKARFTRQNAWRQLWQDLADILLPGKANFTSQTAAGEETGADIYDTTPRQALRGLATSIDGLLKSSTVRWFWMKARLEGLNEDDEAKRWFDAVGNSMWASIYNPTAGFISQSGDVDRSLAAFGWGALWIGENKDHNGLNFKSIFIGDVAIDENADSQIDSGDIIRRYTARQAKQLWKEEKLGPKLLEALRSSNPTDQDKLFEFRQCVGPRGTYDQRKRDNLNLPFEDVIVCVEDEHIIEESGYHEFPMAVPRWEVSANQVYPRSPGMMALPDARTLQAMGHTLLVGGQLAVDPPRWIVDGSFSAVRAWPGGLTVVDAETIAATNGHPIGTLETGANIPVGREMQQDYRSMVEAAFFKNVFNLPVEGPEMTAYEVAQRKEEFLRTIGPVMGQLENDYIGAIVNRVFGIMMRRSVDDRGEPIPGGPFPPPPESLQNQGARFEFMSPIQRAQKQIEAAGMSQAFQFIGPALTVKPKAALRFDVDQIVQDLPDVFGLPQRWLRPKADYEAELAQIAEAEAAAMAGQEIGQAAEIGKTGADAVKSVAQAEAQTA